MLQDAVLVFLVGVVEHKIQNQGKGDHPQDHPPLPIAVNRVEVADGHADEEQDDVGLLRLDLELDGEVLLHLVVPVEVVLVDPVEQEQHDREEEDEVGDLEDVEGVEAPDIEGHHQFEFDGEGGGGYLLVETLLTVFVSLAGLTQQLLPLLLVEPVAQVDQGNDEAHQGEGEDGTEELLELHVLGHFRGEHVEGGWGDQVEEEVEDDSGHHDEVGLGQLGAGPTGGHHAHDDHAVYDGQDDDENGDEEPQSGPQSWPVVLLLVDLVHGEVEDDEGEEHEPDADEGGLDPDLLLVGGGLPDVVPVYLLRLGHPLGVVTDGIAPHLQHLRHVVQELDRLVHLQRGVHPLLLFDRVEHNQDLLAVFVHVLAEDLGLIVEGQVFLVLSTQLRDLLVAIVALQVLLEVADLVVEVEELPVGRGEVVRFMQVEHLIDFHLGIDFLQFLLEVLELVVEGNVLDDQ